MACRNANWDKDPGQLQIRNGGRMMVWKSPKNRRVS